VLLVSIPALIYVKYPLTTGSPVIYLALREYVSKLLPVSRTPYIIFTIYSLPLLSLLFLFIYIAHWPETKFVPAVFDNSKKLASGVPTVVSPYKSVASSVADVSLEKAKAVSSA
jgi:hypothetical protein